MNLEEFVKLYGNVAQKSKVEVMCLCGRLYKIRREKAIININNPLHNGNYICRHCSMEESHKRRPVSEETKQKQREGRLGIKLSEETKSLMSQSKKEFYQTPKGIELRKKLSKSTAEQHSSKKMDKSKRKVLYLSAKNNGDIRVCISSYEFIACEDFLEKDSTVISYETQVSYEIEGRHRSLDLLVNYDSGVKKVVEIKPSKRLAEKYHASQIDDSRKNAELNGWGFEIWTEKELNIKKCKDATKRADEYRKNHYLIDFQTYRKQKDKSKSKKHYDNKISNDKIIVFCSFCRKYHIKLKISYNNNMKKNGRFICIHENGHLVGKKSKNHLKNPLESEGKKRCTGCNQIRDLSEFSTNGKIGNRRSECKPCRAKKYAENYQKKGKRKSELEGPREGIKYKGVSFKKNRNQYQARLSVHHLGWFSDEIEAAENFDFHSLRLYGKGNCYLNFPNKDYTNFVPKREI